MLTLEKPPADSPLAPSDAAPPAGLSYALFRWAGNRFAIEITGVQEVLARLELTPLPRAAHGWLGVTNLRGEILPVVSLSAWFAGTDAPAPVFLVLRTALGKLALAADGFEHVTIIPVDALVEAPTDAADFVTGRWSPSPGTAEPVCCMNSEGLARNLQAQFTAAFQSSVAS